MLKQILLTMLCLTGLALYAQSSPKGIASPVKWSVSAKKADGESYIVTFEATIEKDWVVYSTTVSDGPIPTSFDYDEGVQVIGEVIEPKNGIEDIDPIFDIKLTKYKNEAVFSQEVKPIKGSKVISGHIEYMTCDGSKCLPPVYLPFSVDI